MVLRRYYLKIIIVYSTSSIISLNKWQFYIQSSYVIATHMCIIIYKENKIMLLTISIVINRSQLDNSEKCRLYNVIIIRTFNLKFKKKIYQRERSQLKIIGSSSHRDDCIENIIKLLQSVWIDFNDILIFPFIV